MGVLWYLVLGFLDLDTAWVRSFTCSVVALVTGDNI